MKLPSLFLIAAVCVASAQTPNPTLTEARQKYSTAEAAAIKTAIQMYPDSGVEGSALNKALQARAEELQKSRPDFFRNPNWPVLLAMKVAGELGIQPSGGSGVDEGGGGAGKREEARPAASLYDFSGYQRFVELTEDMVYIAPNGAHLDLRRGDYFPFHAQDNSKVFFDIEGVGRAVQLWNKLQIFAATTEVARQAERAVKRVNNQFAFEIPDDIGDVYDPYLYQNRVEARKTMARIAAMAFYGVATENVRVQGWNLRVGESFPFLGFQGNAARLAVGGEYIMAPRDAVSIVKAAEHPEVAESYGKVLKRYEGMLLAEQAAAAQEEKPLDAITRKLEVVKQLEQR